MPKIYDENGIATEIDDSVYYSLDDLPGEEWKDIFYFDEKKGVWVDFRGKYQISNKGRVKSLFRRTNSGKVINEMILRPHITGQVTLNSNNLSGKNIRLPITTWLRILFGNQINNSFTRPVICPVLGKKYNSIADASRDTGIMVTYIQASCSGRQKSTGRLVDGKIILDGRKYKNQGEPLVWRYLDEYER